MIHHWIKISGVWTPARKEGNYWLIPGVEQYITRVEEIGELITKRPEEAPEIEKTEIVEVVDLTERNKSLFGTEELEPLSYESTVVVRSTRPNDCPVVALANVLQLSWSEARVICFNYGWSSARGMSLGLLEKILQDRGYRITFKPVFVGKALQYVTGIPKNRTFLCRIAKHVMPVVNGEILNVVKGSENAVITEMLEVHPPELITEKTS